MPSTPINPNTNTKARHYKEELESLLKSPLSDQALCAALNAQYVANKNPYLLDYVGDPRLARGLNSHWEGQNLLIVAVQRNDIPLIKALIEQPCYQNNPAPPFLRFPRFVSTYLAHSSEEAFNLIYKAGIYKKEELQKSILSTPQLFTLESLDFLLTEGYYLSVQSMLDSTEGMELLPGIDHEYIEFFKTLVSNQFSQINAEFLLNLDNELNEFIEVYPYYFNTFMAYTMVIASVLSARPEDYYQEIGEKLSNKLLYIIGLERVFNDMTEEYKEEVEAQLLQYKDKYLTMPQNISTAFNKEDLLVAIKSLDIKIERHRLQTKLAEHNEYNKHIEQTTISGIELVSKKESGFKI